MVVTVENVDEVTQCKFEGVVKVLRFNSRIDEKVEACPNAFDVKLLE